MKQIALCVLIGFSFTACTSSMGPSYNSYVYKGMDFGSDRNDAFKRGVQDGCRTASGSYTKDHEAFKANISYRDGWGNGRLQCHSK